MVLFGRAAPLWMRVPERQFFREGADPRGMAKLGFGQREVPELPLKGLTNSCATNESKLTPTTYD